MNQIVFFKNYDELTMFTTQCKIINLKFPSHSKI